VEVDAEIMDNISTAEIMFNLRRLNGRLAPGTTHKIVYTIMAQTLDDTKFEAIYDISNERWLKCPAAIKREVETCIIKLNETLQSIDITTGKIHRNLVDMQVLRSLGKDNLEIFRFYLQQKLNEIEESIKYQVAVSSEKMLHNLLSNKNLTISDIHFFQRKYNMNENLALDTMKRYYILKLSDSVESLIDSNEFNIHHLIKMNKVGRKFWRA
jgi:hypothetical protein